MATDIGRAHGGDGGDRPPHGNPKRILTECESSKLNNKRRGRGKNIKLHKKIDKNEGPLSIEIVNDGGQCRFVGENQSDFIRLISNEVDRHVPYHYNNWRSAPSERKRKLFPILYDCFDMESWRGKEEWDIIRMAIDAECRRAYSERKNELKKHFIKNGGYDDVDAALNAPPDFIDLVAWQDLINILFLDPKYIARCEANKKNRSKQRYTSSHGSKSYAQRRHMEGLSCSQVFEKTHYKEPTGWVHSEAETDFNKVQEEVRKARQEADDPLQVDEMKCFARALGVKSCHRRGIGRTMRQPVFNGESSFPPPPQSQWRQEMEDMRQQNADIRQQNERMQQQLQDQQNAFTQQQAQQMQEMQSFFKEQLEQALQKQSGDKDHH